MEELLKQTEADIAEVKNAIRRLRYKRARTKHLTEIHNISVKILKAESMLADLLRTKAEIEEYLKVGEKTMPEIFSNFVYTAVFFGVVLGLGIVFEKQLIALEDKFDSWVAKRKEVKRNEKNLTEQKGKRQNKFSA